jgi:hypothetical protein
MPKKQLTVNPDITLTPSKSYKKTITKSIALNKAELDKKQIKANTYTRLSDETCKRILDKIITKALNGNDGEGDTSCALFLASKFIPNVKNGFIDISSHLPELNNLDNINKASEEVFNMTAKGVISLDQGNVLMELIEKRRKCFETNVLAYDIENLKNKHKIFN